MPAALAPRFAFDALHPRGCAFAPRSSVERMHWFGAPPWRIDALTGVTLTCMGSMPLICHEAVASDAALAFLELSGIQKPHSLILYRSEQEAVTRARECVSAGMKLAYPYPPPPGADAAEMLLVPVDLYASLNNKATLAELVPPPQVPPRRIVARDAIADLAGAWPARPVFVKAAIEGAHGAGRDVRFCGSADEWAAAISWALAEREHLRGIIVEEAQRFVATWCLNFTVLDDECLYLGAAEQLFSSTGVQSGSRIDPRNAPPAEAIAIGQEIAQRARAVGYRGLCGFDVGTDEAERLFVFDLNFRLNACTPQVLMHDSATRRIGASVSQSFIFRPTTPLGAALERLQPWAEAGRLVPLRIFDAALADAPESTSIVSGLLVAGDAAGVQALEAELTSLLAACPS